MAGAFSQTVAWRRRRLPPLSAAMPPQRAACRCQNRTARPRGGDDLGDTPGRRTQRLLSCSGQGSGHQRSLVCHRSAVPGPKHWRLRRLLSSGCLPLRGFRSRHGARFITSGPIKVRWRLSAWSLLLDYRSYCGFRAGRERVCSWGLARARLPPAR